MPTPRKPNRLPVLITTNAMMMIMTAAAMIATAAMMIVNAAKTTPSTDAMTA